MPSGYRMETIDIGDGDLARVKVVRWRGFDGFICRWTGPCSGCSESRDGGGNLERGSGCHECGYHGVTRNEEWLPLPRESGRWVRRRDDAHKRLLRMQKSRRSCDA
jgi:hypothetical protein